MNSKRFVSKKEFNKVITVPSSKSYANRVIVLAAICSEPVTIKNLPKSTDVDIMLRCLKEVGLQITEIDNGIIIENSFPACEQDLQSEITLETGDGGTTNRFIIPFLALGKKKYNVEAKGGMRSRPMTELEKFLKELNCKIIRNDQHWFSVQGPMESEVKSIEVECSRSTQFATGLALALSEKEINIKTLGLEASKQYFELTESLISTFSDGKREFIVPVDFSSLSYPLALGLVSKGVTVSNCLEKDLLQADSVFLDIIKEMGGFITFSHNGLEVRGRKELKTIDLDCSAFPDLVPTLAFVCSKASGISILRNLEVLRHKESDRVDEIIKILKSFNVQYEFDDEKQDLYITGSQSIVDNSIEYTPAADHRMVMVSYLFMRINNGGELGNYEHVAKSFANFFEVMED